MVQSGGAREGGPRQLACSDFNVHFGRDAKIGQPLMGLEVQVSPPPQPHLVTTPFSLPATLSFPALPPQSLNSLIRPCAALSSLPELQIWVNNTKMSFSMEVGHDLQCIFQGRGLRPSDSDLDELSKAM